MKKILLFLLLSYTAVQFLSCNKEDGDYDTFTIKVDSIQTPVNIHSGEPFDIKFYGVIGTNGCYEFDRFKTFVSNDIIKIEVIGKKAKNVDVCPAFMVYLDGKILTQTIDIPGYYYIKIKQPDGSYLKKQILVK